MFKNILNNVCKYKKYIIYGVLLFLICMLTYYFPLSGKDYLLYDGNINLMLENFQFGYIGNYLAMLMVSSNIIKTIIIGLTIFVTSIMIGKIINEKDQTIPVIFMVLLSIINSKLLVRSLVNVSNFSNYFFPLMLFSIYLYFMKKVLSKAKFNFKDIVIPFILTFIIGLFNDYISIVMVLSNLFILIYKWIKNKQIDYKILALFIVSLVSLILMFTSTDLIYGTKHIFDYSSMKIGFITNAVRNYFNVIQNNFLTDYYLISLFVALCVTVLANKVMEDNVIVRVLSSFIILFNTFFIIINAFAFDVSEGVIHYFISITSVVYLLVLFILILMVIKKKDITKYIYLMFLLLAIIGVCSITYKLELSAIMYLYYFFIVLGLEIYNYLRKSYSRLVFPGLINSVLVLVVILISLICVYKEVYDYNLQRDEIIYRQYNTGQDEIFFPVDKYTSYVIDNYPISKKMQNAYLRFMGIDNSKTTLKLVDKEDIRYKLIYSDNSYDNLMIVAHPDDELIWGGKELMVNDYVVVCITCGNDINPKRVVEFQNVMNELDDEYLMLNHTDLENGKKSEWLREYDDILQDIKEIINYKEWDKIVVHSPFGESGHIHHKMTNKITTSLVQDKSILHYFAKYYYDESKYPEGTQKIEEEYVKIKDEIFNKYYKSQGHVKFQRFYAYERIWSYKDWHEEYDPEYEYN